MNLTISDLRFEHVGILRLERETDGRAKSYRHELRPEVKTNRYAAGPFCDFKLIEANSDAGVYALTVDNEVMYIGECRNLMSRFSSAGYGHVSPRNCHGDGQATNCKINSKVLQVSEARDSVHVWFLPANGNRKQIESRLIQEKRPPWNGRILSKRPDPVKRSSFHLGTRRIAITSNQFGRALQNWFVDAERSGKKVLRVRAGDLHRSVGGYPGPSHRMPVCCAAMRKALSTGDVIVAEPPKGKGADLVIDYRLPRK